MLVLTSYLHLEKSKIEFSQDKTQNSDETIVFDRESTSHGPKRSTLSMLSNLSSIDLIHTSPPKCSSSTGVRSHILKKKNQKKLSTTIDLSFIVR